MARTRDAGKAAKEKEVLQRIAEAVEKLAGEVGILRSIIVRLQDDFAWALNNDAFRGQSVRRERSPPLHITSLPRDPLAPDWHERINRFRPEGLPDDEDSCRMAGGPVQQDLFSGQ